MDRVDDHASGDWLRRERMRRHLTLAQVAQATRIRERYLTAIENDNVDELPAPVFAVGLIKVYAKFLSLDPEPFVRAYQARNGTLAAPRVSPEPGRDPYVSRRSPTVLVPVAFVVVLLALAGYLYQQVEAYVSGSGFTAAARGTPLALSIPTPLPSPPPPPPPSPTPVPPSPTALPTAAPATPTRVAPPTATEIASATPDHGVRIDTTISGRVWLQVEADGKVVFSGILMPGEKRSWTATKSLMLWSGNAGNVQVTYNGKPLGALGPFGKVMKVTWTAPA